MLKGIPMSTLYRVLLSTIIFGKNVRTPYTTGTESSSGKWWDIWERKIAISRTNGQRCPQSTPFNWPYQSWTKVQQNLKWRGSTHSTCRRQRTWHWHDLPSKDVRSIFHKNRFNLPSTFWSDTLQTELNFSKFASIYQFLRIQWHAQSLSYASWNSIFLSSHSDRVSFVTWVFCLETPQNWRKGWQVVPLPTRIPLLDSC